MSRTQLGMIFCLSFVTLEAFQAVYLGSVFQEVDSFLVGAWVLGISVVGCTLATAVLRPLDLVASVAAWRIVAVLNVFAALTWVVYFIAIQLIEPAVVFTMIRAISDPPWLSLPCSRLFTATITSLMLEKKLLTPVRANSGTMKR